MEMSMQPWPRLGLLQYQGAGFASAKQGPACRFNGKTPMQTKKPPHPLRASELDRFERNLANWLKLDPAEAMYHRFQGILESQIVTLKICGVITSQGAVKLLTRMGDARRENDAADAGQKTEGLKLV